MALAKTKMGILNFKGTHGCHAKATIIFIKKLRMKPKIPGNITMEKTTLILFMGPSKSHYFKTHDTTNFQFICPTEQIDM